MKKKNNQIPIVFYAMMDVVTAALAWGICYFFRKWLLTKNLSSAENFQLDYKFWAEISFVPLGWLILYAIAGTYRSLYKKSRLFELTITFICTLIGCIVLFFLFILDDTRDNYSYYYTAFFCLSAFTSRLLFSGDSFFLNIAKQQLLKGSVQFNSLIVGNSDYVNRIFHQTEKNLRSDGYYYAGYVAMSQFGKNGTSKKLPTLGNIESLESIIDNNNITRLCWRWKNLNTPWLKISLTAQ